MPRGIAPSNPAPQQATDSQIGNLDAAGPGAGPPQVLTESSPSPSQSSRSNQNPYRSRPTTGLKPGTSLLDAITDVKLKKAVTPIIAPMLWAFLLGYFGLLLVDHLIWFIRSFTESGSVEGSFTIPEQLLYLMSDLPSGFLRLVFAFFDILTGIFLFMMARVIVEGLVVAFSILTTLQSINSK